MGERTLAIVVKGHSALATPEGHPGGPIPTVDELSGLEITQIDAIDRNGIRVVTSFAGKPPADWRWLPIAELQAAVDEETATDIGEALLC